jgi:hypothetical protein
MELLSAWAPLQPWCGAPAVPTLQPVGAYRFDDPEGEVGIETHLLRNADGQVLQVPLTYRGEPMAGAEASLVGTTQHSVLGERWVYDACGDPVYAQALATAMLTGGTQADLEVVTDKGYERRQATTTVIGSGVPGSPVPTVRSVTYWSEGQSTIIKSGVLELTVLRLIDVPATEAMPGACALAGTWPGHATPALLASGRSARAS